ncbi:integrase family protein [Ktedonobacter racemifer DSM 44963]|uniref:Integrase family protein n=1 Tax=Ktedonobacter racemifer DSM 44963 TaxID=485913 RepID=D6TQA6_KTERA|nr:integrase family protein [Ktedonobacter racemifer DSM 44963]
MADWGAALVRGGGAGVPAALRTTAPAKVVQELLGHSQISMTLDIYSHVLPNMQRDAIERLNQALSLGLEVEGESEDE